MTTETLSRIEAEKLATHQLQAELGRTRAKLARASKPSECNRLAVREAVFVEVLAERGEGHVCPQCKKRLVKHDDPRTLCATCQHEPMRPARAD